MENNYPHLFSPIRIRNVTFRNRIFATPITTLSDLQSQIAFFEAKAKGGAAQVSLAETPVTRKYLLEPMGTTFVLDGDEADLIRLGEFVIAIQAYGAVPSVQLNHHGQQVRPERNCGRNPIGPMGYVRKDGVEVVAMDEEMIEEAIESFAKAAAFCKLAGFEMCMLHGAHGWLIAQFLSPYNNKRIDRWGGSLENRARFVTEIIRRIRQRCGRDFLIEYRISGDELIEGGMQISEVVEFVKMIEEDIDIIHVSAGIHDNHFTIKKMFPVISFTKPGCNVYLAEEMKKHVRIPVMTVGGINTPEQAEQILAEGKADIIGLGRQLLCDPEFPNKARKGLRNEIIPCMRCNSCIAPLLPGGSFHFSCSANPRIGRDRMLQRIQPPKESRRVVVVGGGPGGMMAAITAAERGHRVTLLEKSDGLGGLLRTMDHEPAKWEVRRYKDFLAAKVSRTVPDVRLNAEATPEVVKALNPDVVIAAVGSTPLVPDIPGLDRRKALTAMDVYYSTEKVGKSVVIVGGGLLGCETALFLTGQGRRVTIVEILDRLGDPTYVHYNTPLVEAIDNSPNIAYRLGTKCVEITSNGIVVEKDGKIEELLTDSVVFTVGQMPEMETVESLRDCADEFYSVGDCVKPQRIAEATRTGFFSAMNIS
jgi:2,4-dienoyl-CoA reductase-like NADH-dependent reductase (Old Yellow Enzyme family)/NADPH-dependent 2,4-dienoyl-CoA reductase/sulfur reductase-like enzyme